MPPLPPSGRRRALLVATLSALLLAPIGVAVSQHSQAATTDFASPQGTTGSDYFIVELNDPPLPRYEGGIDGLTRTSPQHGAKLDVTSQAARAYTARLRDQQNDVLASVDATAVPDRHYTTALNGVAVHGLSAEKIRQLEANPNVKKVWRSARRQGSTINTPESLGLAGPSGVWNTAVGGPQKAGRGMIIGVIDAGIWPEHPSFAPLKDTSDQAEIDKKFPPSRRACEKGENGPPMVCNNKIISARYFAKAYTWKGEDYKSPRGRTNHGTGTASVAAGNYGVPVKIYGEDYGTMSGMAPAARISVYKALYESGDGVDGDLVDLVYAIDTAVGDRVDIINYSVTSQRDGAAGLESIAFFNAAKAGTLVVSTAGNEGRTTGEGSVMATAPWMLSVAGVTREWTAHRELTLGNNTKLTGVGYSTRTLAGPLVRARDVEIPNPNADPATTGICGRQGEKAPGVTKPFLQLDPAKVKGKVVVCERGVIGVMLKSEAVAAAGGLGVININTNPAFNDTWVDYTKVPAIHLELSLGKKVLEYAATPGATINVAPSKTGKSQAPMYWQDSSPGPASLGNGDLLKPDLAAPSLTVLSAANPTTSASGSDVAAMSGTSIAAPHVAGIAALVKQVHPDWSPQMIQSALMTTATRTDNTGGPIKTSAGRDATPHQIGSGQVNAKDALNPGVVITSNPAQWKSFACSVGQWQLYNSTECKGVSTMKATELNYPSISTGALTGTEVFTRSLTNVTGEPVEVTYEQNLPAGYQGLVRPDGKVQIEPGKSQFIRLYINRTDAPLNQWSYGSLTYTVTTAKTKKISRGTLPIALRPAEMRTPHMAVIGEGNPSGSADALVTSSLNGTLSLRPLGFATETVSRFNITPVANDFTVTVPEKTAAIAWRIPVERPGGAAPLAAPPFTVTVFKDGKVVARSFDFDMYGQTVLTSPAAGTYKVSIKGELPQISVPNAPIHQYLLSMQTSNGDVSASVKEGTNTARVNNAIPVTVSWKNAPKGYTLCGAVASVADDDAPPPAPDDPNPDRGIKGVIAVAIVK